MGVDGRCKAFTETFIASPRTRFKKEGIDAAVYVTSQDMERARALAVTRTASTRSWTSTCVCARLPLRSASHAMVPS